MSYWGWLPRSIPTTALRTFAMILRWQHQLVLICIVALGVHTENISDYDLAAQIDGGVPLAEETQADRRGCGENGLHGNLERPFSHHLGILEGPIFNCHFFFFFIAIWHLSISHHTTSRTLPRPTRSWHFGFNGRIQKIKRRLEGRHWIIARDAWK